MKVYLTDIDALAWFQQQATPDFWDTHWQIDDLRRYLEATHSDGVFLPVVRRHLLPGSLVLEGGCGRGQLVRALNVNGYRSVGIDFAERTVDAIRRAMPALNVHVGDVRALPIEDNTLDGYISAGVIEHFWHGYHDILAEMQRALRPGGVLFLSFPYVSPLRRWKLSWQSYPTATHRSYRNIPQDFYQFALPVNRVLRDLEGLGFTRLELCLVDGIKGVKDEVAVTKSLLQAIYDGRRGTHLRPWLDKMLKSFGAHSVLLVMKKTR